MTVKSCVNKKIKKRKEYVIDHHLMLLNLGRIAIETFFLEWEFNFEGIIWKLNLISVIVIINVLNKIIIKKDVGKSY